MMSTILPYQSYHILKNKGPTPLDTIPDQNGPYWFLSCIIIPLGLLYL